MVGAASSNPAGGAGYGDDRAMALLGRVKMKESGSEAFAKEMLASGIPLEEILYAGVYGNTDLLESMWTLKVQKDETRDLAEWIADCVADSTFLTSIPRGSRGKIAATAALSAVLDMHWALGVRALHMQELLMFLGLFEIGVDSVFQVFCLAYI